MLTLLQRGAPRAHFWTKWSSRVHKSLLWLPSPDRVGYLYQESFAPVEASLSNSHPTTKPRRGVTNCETNVLTVTTPLALFEFPQKGMKCKARIIILLLYTKTRVLTNSHIDGIV